MPVKLLISRLRLPVYFLGVVLLFATERYFSAEKHYLAMRIAALLLMGIGIALTLLIRGKAARAALHDEARAWSLGALWQTLVLAGAGVWIAYAKAIGNSASADTLWQKSLLALWLLLLLLGFSSGIGVEWAIRQSGRGELAEYRRVHRAWLSWMAVGLLLGVLVSINYAGAQRDRSWDWSYLKVTTPSESTQKMVATLAEPMQVGLFFPPGNEVRPYVESYFKALAAKESRVVVNFYDKDMHPSAAEKLKVTKNGQVVFDVNGKQERIDVGVKIAQARNTLRKMDREFQKVFLQLTQQKKTAYFTRGHGEMSWLGSEDKSDPFRSIRIVEALLRDLNYSLKFLGTAEGLASQIPDDAGVVVVAGATQAFLQEEIETLKKFLEKGGKLLVMLDIETGADGSSAQKLTGPDPLLGLLEGVGVRYNNVPLVNDKSYITLTNSQADKAFLFTNIFTSHESVATLARHEERVALAVFRSGWLSVTPELSEWKSFETVRAMSDTFNDENRNFAFDAAAKEQRNSYVLGAVSQKKDARILTFADASAFSDVAMRNPANQVYLADGLKWLVGETKFAGETTSEEDVKIQHTRKEDVVWFHGTVVVVPLLVIAAGAIATRRGRKNNRSDRKAAGGNAHAS